ncbi:MULTISPECIES: GYDIA family GHMP kinase [Maribacter]|uniref:GYDIA family GHMP kinase n=1 Tax=Maribacter flavus TaxID=1658664 RepID=A0ABU7IFV0_9FLAO|nr:MULTISPECIES: GYDIA family GHMP kinase [Maribacter]MDC6405376.1 GYDIA family GHMP kinase [Maribacter sp. PR66]MEE1971815.1 GYDIA family GHMP kinase [Maribacter flavus]
MTEFYSNGKLLLTGEYAILDGANGLAIPTKFGQYLSVKNATTGQINWQSLTDKNIPWFTVDLSLKDFSLLATSDVQFAERLISILRETKALNPSFLDACKGVYVDTKLTFPKDWGLGSSSTLINNISQWAQVDPYKLLEATFGGSGYDIACAQNDTPIVYHKIGGNPKVEKVNFDPVFKNRLFFIYLNKKQNSRDAIKAYRQLNIDKNELITQINGLTTQLIAAKDLGKFETVINRHEHLLSKTLKVETIKNQLFPDYQGCIKSLGAWGGDFILATGTMDDMQYFRQKGYDTILPYSSMVL